VAFALIEHLVHGPADLLAEQLILDLVERRVRVDLLDEIAELGVLSDRGLQRQGSRRPISVRSSISSTVVSSALASSSRVGSRPIDCANWNLVRLSLRSRSWMCTGRRIERERSAIARVISWRIHHVAYVENLKPRRQSNSSTARIRPMLPS
jgi:hypothetical protein